MSAIEKLQICGVRSFSPHRNETIEFYSPLTMIVGANGCGKTTIIECLKMACTGVLPPGCKNGHSFINDPTMTDSTEVKAHIKLRFINRAGNPSVVVRLFQVAKKKTKLEFKSLDGTVRITDEKGNKEALSHKCSDLDKLIPEMLGVSSAIMESVVFCHQEESTWPLSEGSVLKKKFDDIFDSSRYAKALDAIVKTKKEYTGKTKELKVDVAELGAHLISATSTREELCDKQEKAQDCQHEVQDILVKMEVVDEKISAIQDRIRVAEKTQRELQELQRTADESDRRLADRLSCLEQEFTESDEELKGLLEGFDEQMKDRREELKLLRQQQKQLENAVEAGRKKVTVLNTRLGEGFAIQQQLTVSEEKEKKIIADIARQMGIATPSHEDRAKRVELLFREIDRLGEVCKDDGQRSVNTAQSLLEKAASESRASNNELQLLQVELNNDEKELAKLQSEKLRLRTELSSCDSSTSQRTARPDAEADLRQAKSQWEDFERNHQAKISKLLEEKRTVENEVRDITDMMGRDSRLLQDMGLQRAENERLDAQRRQAEIDLSTYVATALSTSDKYRDLITRLVGTNGAGVDIASACSFTTCADVDTVSRFLTTQAVPRLASTVNSTNEELRTVQRDLAQLHAQKDQDIRRRVKVEAGTEELVLAESALQAAIERLAELRRECDLDDVDMTPENPEGILDAIKQAEESAAEEEMALRSSKSWRDVIFRKSREKVPPSPSAGRGGTAYIRRCPCCDRGLNADETTVFERSVEKLLKGHKATAEIIEGVKARVERARGIAKQAAECFVKITGFGPQRVELQEISKRVEEAGSREKSLRDKEHDLKLSLEALTRDQKELTVCVMELDRLQNDWASGMQRLTEVKQKLSNMTRGFSSGDAGDTRSIADIEEQQRAREAEREVLQRRKERLMEEDNHQNKKLMSLKANLAEKEKLLMEVVQREQKVTDLESKLRTAEASERSVTTSRDLKSRELNPLKRTAQDREAAEKMCREEVRRAEEKQRQALSKFQNYKTELNRASSDCDSVYQRLQAIDVRTVQQNLEGLEKDVKAKLSEIEKLTPRARVLEDQLKEEERTKKIVLDNIAYRSCKREAEALQERLDTARSRMGPTAERDYRDASRDLQKAQADRQRLERDQHSLEGRLSALEEQVAELKKKLRTPLYKDIDKRHRLKNIEYETTMVAVSDLDAYHKALDSALQKFHEIRIEEINKIIKELWQLVYRGGDIDCIELVSGAEDGSGRATRSYNYRVVMRKGDTPLDMRGRCSAGQRVLASVVIRLALAETFCVSCGMLALDEPTTNLDEAHKVGLAHALSRIIASRSKQHNFQLIVITHDEDFVRMMKIELAAMTDFSMPDHYFRIYRNEVEASGKFFSHIERIPWDDM